MTIVVEGDEKTLEQIKKQLNRLIDVIKVSDYTNRAFIDKELILIKVSITSKNRSEVIQIVDSVEGEVVNVGTKSISVEATGDQNKIKAILELLKPFGILEVVRTGRIAMALDDKAMGLNTDKADER
jgi:acetolactate synthase-1/3 small subunit